jgi:cysteine-rich repeat protein
MESTFIVSGFVLATIVLRPLAAVASPAVVVGSASGAPGTHLSFDVSLSAEGASVASMQNDIAFDPVLTPITSNAGSPDCVVNPATGKSGFFAFLPNGCTGTACTSMRALLVSFFDANPIPDGALYTCGVDVSPTTPAGSYPLAASGVVLATPDAQSVPGAVGVDGAVIVETCGDGVLDVGEQCDDGNQSAGDTCPADCKYTAGNSAIRGHRTAPAHDRTGCQVEWYVAGPAAAPDRYGLPSQKQRCTDQDPACDADPAANRCRFQVAVCMSNDDPALPSCAPAGIRKLALLAPKTTQSHDPTVQALLATDIASLQNAFAHLLDPLDPEAGYGNAVPVDVTRRNLCSAPFAIDVPVHGVPKGTLRLMTRSTDASPSRAKTDSSTLMLTCAPAP